MRREHGLKLSMYWNDRYPKLYCDEAAKSKQKICIFSPFSLLVKRLCHLKRAFNCSPVNNWATCQGLWRDFSILIIWNINIKFHFRSSEYIWFTNQDSLVFLYKCPTMNTSTLTSILLISRLEVVWLLFSLLSQTHSSPWWMASHWVYGKFPSPVPLRMLHYMDFWAKLD